MTGPAVPTLGPLRFAYREGVGIAYQVLGGTGPWTVLVHGLGYGRFGWGPFAALLAAHRRVVLIDNRGIGDSDRPPGPYSVDEMAADIVSVLDQLQIEQCDLAGASLGGMVALQLAATYPDRVRHLVLIAATPGEPQGAPLPPNTSALLRGEIRLDANSPRRLIEGALAAGTVASRPSLVDLLLALREEQGQPPEAWRAQAAASAGFSLSTPLGSIEVPTLAVSGTDDAVIDPVNTLIMTFALPVARAVYFAPAGHLCFWEEPELLAEAVSAHLDGPPAAAGSSACGRPAGAAPA